MNLIKTAGVLLFAWSATAVPLTDKETALLQEVFSYMEFLKSEDTKLILQGLKKHFDHQLELVQSREDLLQKELKGKNHAFIQLQRQDPKEPQTIKDLEDKKELKGKNHAFTQLQRQDPKEEPQTIKDLEDKIEDINNELLLLSADREALHQQLQSVENILTMLETGRIDDFVEELQGLAENTQKAPPGALYDGYFDVIAEQVRHIRQIDGTAYMYMTVEDLPPGDEMNYFTLVKAHAVFALSQFSVSQYVSIFVTCSFDNKFQTPYFEKDEHGLIFFCSRSRYGLKEK